MQMNTTNFTLYIFLKLSDTPYILSMHIPKLAFQYDEKSKDKIDQILSENFTDLSVSEKEYVLKMSTERVRKDIWNKIFS